jgi:hypothetical protein
MGWAVKQFTVVRARLAGRKARAQQRKTFHRKIISEKILRKAPPSFAEAMTVDAFRIKPLR